MGAAGAVRIAILTPAGSGWNIDGSMGYATEGGVLYDQQYLAAIQASMERCVYMQVLLWI